MREARPERITVPSALMQALAICVESVSHAKGGTTLKVTWHVGILCLMGAYLVVLPTGIASNLSTNRRHGKTVEQSVSTAGLLLGLDTRESLHFQEDGVRLNSRPRSTGSKFSSGQRSIDKKATLTQEHRCPHESKLGAAKG
ncbi:hypothetical protein Q8A73_021031 [Channa argus]|nr:hypothetical protein Q8A73_021031 [Channa argus]